MAGSVTARKRQVEILTQLDAGKKYDGSADDLANAYGGLSWAEILAEKYQDAMVSLPTSLRLRACTWKSKTK